MMTIDNLRDYLRIDNYYDDILLDLLLETAKAYVNGAIEVQNPNDKRFDFAVALLVGHWYENRLATSESALNDIPFGVTALINQLRGLSNGEDN